MKKTLTEKISKIAYDIRKYYNDDVVYEECIDALTTLFQEEMKEKDEKIESLENSIMERGEYD